MSSKLIYDVVVTGFMISVGFYFGWHLGFKEAAELEKYHALNLNNSLKNCMTILSK